MAQQTINIGTQVNSGDGDPIRTAFDKVNDNFTEVYTKVTALEDGNVVTDIKGSVFADDSTLLVDAINGIIPAANLTGTLPALDGSSLTGVTASSMAFSNITSKPTTISGYGITDAYTKTEVDSAITSSVLPSGSTQSIDVVAQDSTVLVDSVNGTLNATTLTGALPAIDGSALTGVTTAFSNITSTPTTLAGYGITDAVTAGGDFEGNLSGSVFADDSTLLVDGVNGKITGEVTGTISSINWMASSDSYLTIANGGATGPAPIQIVASANLDLTSGNNNDIIMSPHGSGRVKVSDGGLGIVEAATFIGHADQTMYLSSKTTGTESTHITLNSTSGVQTTLFGAVDFVSGGSVDFTGSTVTGLNVTGDVKGSVFADDSTLLVDAVAGKIVADVETLGTVTAALVDAGNIITSGAVHFNGVVKIDAGTEEAFATTNGATGVTALDCATGNVHYLTAPAGDITANFTNLGLTAEYATNLTVIINQGATPYEVTAVQIGGAAQTIEWQGGLAPTGNANGIDSFSFTILNDGGSFVVLGQMVDFT